MQISLNNKTFSSASFLLNFISTINRCPILSLWDRFLMIELNFYRQGVSFYFLCNHRWEVLSLHFHNDCFCPFKYFRDDSFCFGFPIIFYVIDNFYIWSFTSLIFIREQILVSNASHVFAALNPTINVFSKSWITSASVGKAIITLLFSLCTQRLNTLAALHFLGLNLNFFLKKLLLSQKLCTKLSYLENCTKCWDFLNFSFLLV